MRNNRYFLGFFLRINEVIVSFLSNDAYLCKVTRSERYVMGLGFDLRANSLLDPLLTRPDTMNR